MIGAATAYALEVQKKRKEEERRLAEEAARLNADARERERVEQATLAALKEACEKTYTASQIQISAIREKEKKGHDAQKKEKKKPEDKVEKSVAAQLVNQELAKGNLASTLSGDCVVSIVLALANGIGTLLLLTGVGTDLGLIFLGANLIAQVIQIVVDVVDYFSGKISKKLFWTYMGLNILDVIPIVGIFSEMRSCGLDKILEFFDK